MQLVGLTRAIQRAKFLLTDNSPAILTGIGVVGTLSTAYLSGRASFKAARLLEQQRQENAIALTAKLDGENETEYGRAYYNLSKWQKVKLVWRLYIPPFATAVTTVTSIVFANKIASKKMAALAVASGISERALQEYKAKVIEKLGERQDTKIRDEIAQDRVNKHPLGSKEVILAGTGKSLCYDLYSGRYFESSVEDIKRAENKVNHELNNFMACSLSEFYDEIGLQPTSHSDAVGWNAGKRLEVQFSTVMSTNDQPCIAIDYVTPPFADYRGYFD